MDYEEKVSELEEELPRSVRDGLLEKLKEEEPSKKKTEEMIKRTEEAYRDTKYEAGEALGVVAAQSIGEPATQMSLDSDEKVIIKQDGRAGIAEIGEFVDRAIDKKSSRKSGNWEVSDLESEEIFVPSITEDEKMEWRKVLECSRHSSPDNLLLVRTRSGRKIKATASHSFIVREDNRIKAVGGQKLSIGDRISVMKKLHENCMGELKVNDLIDTKWAKKELPEILKLDEKLGWIFGAYLAEGNCTKNYVSFSNTNQKFLQRLRNFAKTMDFTYNEYEHERGFSKSRDLRINSRLLSKLLEKTCGTGSDEKKVPKFAYSAEDEFVSGLLQGYFDGDGSVSSDKKLIKASSRSKELVGGILLLLSRFGIFAAKQEDEETSLIIPYKFAEKFKENIGLSHPDKQKELERFVGEKPSQEFIDQIPGFGNLLKDMAAKLDLPPRRVNSFTDRGKIGRETLRRWINIFTKRAEEKGIDIDEELSELGKMVSSEVVWDEIVDIKKVKPSSEYVYDFSVEGTQTFTTFEGVVTHNTMRTYHVAGAAQGVQITQGLPRLIEVVDARKTLSTPAMEVFLEEDFQNEEDAKKVAGEIRETKLDDVVTEDRLDLLNLVVEVDLNEESIEGFGMDAEEVGEKVGKRRRKFDVEVEGNTLKIVPGDEDISVRELQQMKNKALDKRLKGIKDVTQAVVMERDGEWMIETLGSNLKKALKVEGVDATRTRSNDPRDMYKVFGIEACRNMVLKEGSETIEEQGLDVDIRHMMLVSDIMTADGELKAIGRYGVAGEKGSALARASFEVTVRHLTDAAIEGEADSLESTVENILINQTVPVGTGMSDLVFKPDQKKEK